jgi:hypothetical protein
MKLLSLTPPLSRTRVRVGFLIAIFGFLLFLIGARPDIIGQDRSPVIGFVQIAVFLSGLGIICVGGYMTLDGLWNGYPRTIASDIGLRLVSTGFIIAVACGMADVFGFGTQSSPAIPYFGVWQMRGVLMGQGIIGLGFILMIPFRLDRYEDPTSAPEGLSD